MANYHVSEHYPMSHQSAPPPPPVYPNIHQSSHMNHPAPIIIQTSVPPTQGSYYGSVEFNEHPVYMTCPYCQQAMSTRVETKAGTGAWLITLITLFCIFPLNFFFLCSDCVKDKHHYCSRCNRHVGKKALI